MSTGSRSPLETRSQDSAHGSSVYGAAAALEDTALSVNIGRRRPSLTRSGGTAFPITVFAHGIAAVRSRSASPRPRRSPFTPGCVGCAATCAVGRPVGGYGRLGRWAY